ncbi:hypothetical protein [Proteiniphilum sp. X52]|uniref:hypothetical protein n=1 Tax=Proteiniphilum sp. X52 TaxID=2382159 RepID=UPI000F09F6B0|nr:hypothetical protein [Proteiniphilum sp. X52]RNC65199.1 hypothetical protein D7D25_08535 [Proteiniphilum sp. X52]
MKYIRFFSLILLAVAGGCSRGFDYRISNSVFIEDTDNPGLPVYSEKGYNSFGVYWGLSLWTTQLPHDPSKVVIDNDSCHIHLSGSVGSNLHTLVISFPEYTPATFAELLSLNGKDFDLPGQECAISLLYGNRPMNLKILSGSFTVKRAQKMFIDKELESVVLSGTFSFKATIDGVAETFSNGRFDMRFGNENFYYLRKD